MQEGIFKAVVDGTEFEFELRNGILKLDGQPVDASLVRVGPSAYSLLIDGKSYDLTIQTNGEYTQVTDSGIRRDVKLLDRMAILLEKLGGSGASKVHTLEIRAPMPGLVLAVEVDQHDAVAPGQGVVVLEAMKMENEIFAAHAGVVQEIHVRNGEAVTKGQLLLTLRDD